MSIDNPDEEDSENEYETEDPDTRWKGLSTVLAFAIAISYLAPPLAVVFGPMFGVSVSLSPITQAWWFVLSLAFVTVLAYTFGPDTLKQAKKAIKE